MWVKTLDSGEALVGATAFGIHLAGKLIAFTCKPNGAEVAIGRGMGTVESRKTVQAVHAPISFVLLKGNEAAEENPGLINDDPHEAGWMALVRPTRWAEEKGSLMDADAYRRHVLKIEPEARLA